VSFSSWISLESSMSPPGQGVPMVSIVPVVPIA
jgi:hypothetical protein